MTTYIRVYEKSFTYESPFPTEALYTNSAKSDHNPAEK